MTVRTSSVSCLSKLRTNIVDKLVLILSFAIISFAATGTAQSLPDLIITNDSKINLDSLSCQTDPALAVGRVAIKNIGDDVARPRTVGGGLTMRWLTVYVPQNPDMVFLNEGGPNLEPLDQKGIAFELGTGVLKRGRNFDDPSRFNGRNRQQIQRGSQFNRSIQLALLKLNYDPRGIDGIIGPRTRGAITRFQTEELGVAGTGVLTRSQRNELFSRAKVTSSDSAGAVGGAVGETVVDIYAVVDPQNLIEESNEANNIKHWVVTIDCS
ncbi:MAG: peptidoglycan-binding protein [Methyloligellaceae bacterium]